MQTESNSQSLRLLAILLTLWVLPLAVRSQTPLQLDLHRYAGVTITGAVGTVCQVQYSDDLGTPSNWTPLTNFTLISSPQLLLDLESSGAPHRFYRALSTNMALIPAGSFQMGSTLPEAYSYEQPVHSVYISAFWIDRTEVTKTLWDSISTYAYTNAYTFDNIGSGKAPSHPVHTVNWMDAVKWCNARSQAEGYTPVYYTDAGLTQIYKSAQLTNPYAKWTANGYRLPTEAEWEKAARGGITGRRFPWSDVDTITHHRANYYSDTNRTSYDISLTRGYHPAFIDVATPYTSPVGSFDPNAYGLYDMAGNVRELCWDWMDWNWYTNSAATLADTRGPATPTTSRVVRGGSWDHNGPSGDGSFPRLSIRSISVSVSGATDDLGFRCVRSAP
jgi:formylglycine-generating enzyme